MLSSKEQDAKDVARKYFLSGSIAQSAALGGSSRPFSKNIIGLGVGAKVTDGIILGQEAIRIYVRVKIPSKYLPKGQKAPSDFDGFPTDVVEVGDITTLQLVNTWQRFNRNRPTSCGVSIGHSNVTAGSLGCLVHKDEEQYILSNNHVLADSNKANIGEAIIQPGPADGGTSPADNIGVLSNYKPIDFSGAANDIDAAIATVNSDLAHDVESAIIDIGSPQTKTKQAALYQSVRKHGRTTGHTVGVITDKSADIWVGYPLNNQAWFEDQIAIAGVGCADFAKGGDSGSLIVDAVSLEPVALLFAVANSLTYANPIDSVLNYFGVEIVQ